jgi:aromatic-L-amino-acid decarboxylase
MTERSESDREADVSAGDMAPEDFRRHAHEVADWMADYLATVGDLPVFPDLEPGAIRDLLPEEPPDEGEPMDRVLSDFRDVVVPGLTHWNHPRFFGYFAITASGPGILGEMLTAALNVNAMVWRSSPVATELEEHTTDWLRRLLGLPPEFDGVINDTASSSTLCALAAARAVAWPDAHERGLFGCVPGRVYASDQAHSSVEKAVLTLGLGRSGFGAIPSDREFRMDADALAEAIRVDLEAGVRPVAIVATLGTTSSASMDPVAEIAQVASEFGVWLHVDAAYGGAAAIVPELAPLFDGWQGADSIVVNPHKWLFTPIDCSVLYCRRPADLVAAFSIVPEYLKSSEQASARSLMDYGVSLGRRFRALKLWFVLRHFGRGGLVAAIREHVRLARVLAGWVEQADDWALVAPVHLATIAVRFDPGWAPDAEDRANRRIIERVNRSGEAFLTHTVLAGRTVIRVSIGNLKTTHADVARVWASLRGAADIVRAEGETP